MKKWFVALLLVPLIGLVGCNQSPPGGPGATGKPGTAPRGTAPGSTAPGAPAPRAHTLPGQTPSETFRLSAPSLATRLKQGERKEVTVDVKRAKDFHEDVTLTFTAPKGLTVTPSTHTVKASEADTSVKVTVEAAANAPIG